MAAGKYDIVIEQGATFKLPISYKDSTGSVVDLVSGNGYTSRMMIKESAGGTTIKSLTNGSGMTLAASGNNIVIEISATDTAAMDFSNAVYDLEIVSGTEVTRILEGKVKLSREITA